MRSYLVAMSGASGNMGQAVVREVMTLPYVRLRLLFLDEKRERRLGRRWSRLYGDRVEIFFGNLKSFADCSRLVAGADYVLNMAAVIPPMADRCPDLARDANVEGAANMVRAVESCVPQPKFIHISTVAIYGHRNYLHPWGRVGDPLLPSAYDSYGLGKLIGERTVLDSGVATWAVIRQTGMLYDKLLMSNISDGLMFHTPFNVPIEWATDTDSGVLLRNIFARDIAGEVPDFWRRVYNLGGGALYRTTGYDTFNAGFAMIGGGTEQFLRPNWHATRNFHCMWFSDSGVLEDMFHFRSKSFDDFWQDVLRKNRYFALGKIVPPAVIRSLVFKRLLRDANSPTRWVKEGNQGRTHAFFGGRKEWEALGDDWSNFPVWSKNQIEGYDYQAQLDEAYASSHLLSHGYDEAKSIAEVDFDDLASAASFRGGFCLDDDYVAGDGYQKVTWRCAEGHTFRASPYTVLKAGHWCPDCIVENRWNFDRLSRANPFYRQVWYDSHDKDENNLYYYDEEGVACVREDV